MTAAPSAAARPHCPPCNNYGQGRPGPRSILGSSPSRFEATRQPFSGRHWAADLRPYPLTGTGAVHRATSHA